jgi:hypothetical protein
VLNWSLEKSCCFIKRITKPFCTPLVKVVEDGFGSLFKEKNL